jgi:hypothetical protein
MRPAIVLLGAGASAEAGVPVTGAMTDEIVRRINDPSVHRHEAQVSQALNYVVATMRARDAAAGVPYAAPLNVERVFSAVQLLAERETLEMSPFVASWDPAVESIDAPKPRWPPFFDSDFRKALAKERGFSNLEQLLRAAIRAEIGRGSGGVFIKLMGAMTLALRHVVHIKDASAIAYLQPLLELTSTSEPLVIATLNYDRSIELLAAEHGVDCTTAIEEWATTGRWNWPQRGIALLKLHGSVDWAIETQYPGQPRLPYSAVRVTDPLDTGSRPGLIFGQRGKLQHEGPFLELRSQFAELLQEHNHLLVVGYSFGDAHVNELIRRWLNGDMDRHVTVIDPGFPNGWSSDDDFRMELRSALVPAGPPPGNPQFPARLTVHRERASEALPSVVQQLLNVS